MTIHRTQAFPCAVDTWMDFFNADTNYGAEDTNSVTVLYVGEDKTVLRRALHDFDIANRRFTKAEIISVELHIYVTGLIQAEDAYTWRRCTKPSDHATTAWVEDECTYDDYKAATAWTAGGGDTTDTNKVADTLPTSTGWLVVPGFKGIMEDTIDDANTDRVSLHAKLDDESPEANKSMSWNSKDHATVAQRPYLLVTYEDEQVRVSLDTPTVV